VEFLSVILSTKKEYATRMVDHVAATCAWGERILSRYSQRRKEEGQRNLRKKKEQFRSRRKKGGDPRWPVDDRKIPLTLSEGEKAPGSTSLSKKSLEFTRNLEKIHHAQQDRGHREPRRFSLGKEAGRRRRSKSARGKKLSREQDHR